MAKSNAIVVVNAGSSSLKFSLFGDRDGALTPFLTGRMEGISTGKTHFAAHALSGETVEEQRWADASFGHDEAMRHVIGFIETHLGEHRIEAVGHRIVHGGTAFTEPTRLDAAVLEKLDRLIPLAPLHQPHNLAPVRAILAAAPHLLQVGCFDTAFHAMQPPLAQAYALPASITSRGVRRYGFHGLSYEYIASLLPRLDPALADARVIVAHLGNGASMCALHAGRSVASTMGFTAVEGLPMGTRSGSLDPGIVLYLMDELKMGARDIERLIYEQSGLLGVSGISSDMRTLAASEDTRARLAIDLFTYRINREMGSLAAALGGLDAIIFTAGIGEHDAALRASVCRAAQWLGTMLDAQANANPSGPTRISAPCSQVSAWVVPTDEELMIAQHTRALLPNARTLAPSVAAQ